MTTLRSIKIVFIVFFLTFSVLANAQDADNDGVLDAVDLDDDNDGITDKNENTCIFGFYEDFGTDIFNGARYTFAEKGLPGSSTAYSYVNTGLIYDDTYSISNTILPDMGAWWTSNVVDAENVAGRGFMIVNGLVIIAGINGAGDNYTTSPATTANGEFASNQAMQVSISISPTDEDVCKGSDC